MTGDTLHVYFTHSAQMCLYALHNSDIYIIMIIKMCANWNVQWDKLLFQIVRMFWVVDKK